MIWHLRIMVGRVPFLRVRIEAFGWVVTWASGRQIRHESRVHQLTTPEQTP
jgi:hypothetical protein